MGSAWDSVSEEEENGLSFCPLRQLSHVPPHCWETGLGTLTPKWLERARVRVQPEDLCFSELKALVSNYTSRDGPFGVSVVAQRVKNLTSIHKDAGSIPGLALWVNDLALL